MDPRQTAETFNTLQPILFWLVALVTGFCAVATVITQNIVRAATWLLFTLAGTSAVFFLLGADLVGATQLLVYVGGTLVLVIFGVMLTAQGPFISMKTSGAEWATSVVAGFLLLAVLATAVLSPAVSVGPPLVKTMETIPDGDNKGQKTALHRTPEVKRYAPELSRAQRQIQGALLPLVSTSADTAKKMGGGAPLVPPGKGPGGAPKGKGGAGKGGAPKGKGKGGGKGDAGKGGVPKGKDKGQAGGKEGMPPIDIKAAPPLPTPNVKKPPPEALDPATSAQSATLGQGFIGVPVGPAHPSGRTVVRTSYLLPFEIVSVHLLVVLIGAAYLARAKRRRGGVS